MSAIGIGPVRVLASELAGREELINAIDGDRHEAWVVPALLVGPHQTLLEVAVRRWSDGGEVVMTNRGDSHPYFQRLVQGCRLGIREEASGGPGVAMAGLVTWDPAREWANVKKADISDLDAVLGTDARAELVGFGVDELDTRSSLWGDTSKRRNYLEAQFDPDDPVPPLVIYVLTRVLPVLAAVDEVLR